MSNPADHSFYYDASTERYAPPRTETQASLERGEAMDWQPIETAPENTDILTWSSLNDEHFCVDRFHWVTDITEEIQSETTNAKGRRRVVQEIHEKRREWSRAWGAEYWQPLPEPPQ